MRTYTPRDPEEYILRREIYKYDRARLKSELRRTKDTLNKKLKELEDSGLSRYSRTYEKVMTYLKEELGTTGKRFITRPYANASLEVRQELLLNLKRFDTYEGLTPEGVLKSYAESALRLSTGDLKITSEDLMNIDTFMKDWREYIMHSNIASIFNSNEARSIFVERRNMTREQFDMFMEHLEKFDTNEYRKKDFDVFLRYYDFTKGKVIAERNGIKFNPMNGRIYDDDDEIIKTSYRISADGNVLLKKRKAIKSLSDFTEDTFYDYIFTNKKKRK